MTISHKLKSINLDTGEIMDGQVVLIAPKRKMSYYGGHLSMALEPLAPLANSNIVKSSETMRVLLMLLHRLDYENVITVNHTHLARELNMNRPSVSRAIKRLIDEGLLLVDIDKDGAHKRYKFNPLYVWRGSAKTHAKAVKEHMKRTGIRVVKPC